MDSHLRSVLRRAATLRVQRQRRLEDRALGGGSRSVTSNVAMLVSTFSSRYYFTTKTNGNTQYRSCFVSTSQIRYDLVKFAFGANGRESALADRLEPTVRQARGPQYSIGDCVVSHLSICCVERVGRPNDAWGGFHQAFNCFQLRMCMPHVQSASATFGTSRKG
mgnify:CR=1 FL=1